MSVPDERGAAPQAVSGESEEAEEEPAAERLIDVAGPPHAEPPPAASEPGSLQPISLVEPPVRSAPAPVVAQSRAAVLRERDRATLPILMYHYVDQLPAGLTDVFRKDLTVSPLNFRKQLQYLADNHVKTVSLSSLAAHFRGGDPLPERAVALTFDDGYEDNYRVAFPALKELGMRGTFFVVTDFVGRPGYMTWEQLREMELHGMSIESHSVDHADLTSVPKAELERQLAQSRRVLEEHLTGPVRYLCYPSGKYNPAVMAAAEAAGYEAATSINHGLVQLRSEVYELNRVRVRGTDTIDQLAARMVPPSWKHFRGPFGR